MSKEKIVLSKSDWTRTVLSDTAPAEVPVIVSNDGFYSNLISMSRPDALNIIIESFFKPSTKKRYSKPYNYKITKDRDSFRRLSLPHPRAQLEVADFYKAYHSLISHYSQLGPFSIRRPKRLASYYYSAGKNEDAFLLKAQDIMAEGADKTAKHAASMFAYSGYRKLYRFFSSPTYSTLERKFRHLSSLDVNKCFDSIYTHSIAWALKSKPEAKVTTTASTFGGAFDRLMQTMNYNETNGIIIGPEVSRIFSEVIFNRIDVDIERSLSELKLRNGVDYAILRYVDNIYVFYNAEDSYRNILSAIIIALDTYKLSLNQAKTEKVTRPFFTQKSLAISEAESIISSYFDVFIDKLDASDGTLYFARPLSFGEASLKNFSVSLRKACFSSSLGYESIAGFLLAALRRRVQRVTMSAKQMEAYFDSGGTLPEIDNLADYRASLSRFLSRSLDMCMHTYTLAPSVAGSLDVATMIILSAHALKECDRDLFVQTRERLQMWVSRLFESFEMRTLAENSHANPVEVQNILCALRPFDFDGRYFQELIDKSAAHSASYFSTVVSIFVLGADKSNEASIVKLLKDAELKILSDIDLGSSSESAHLFLDLLSCPFIPTSKRRGFFRSVTSAYNKFLQTSGGGGGLSIPSMTNSEVEQLVGYMERNPWFVDWREINLLRFIERKRLKAGYE